MLVDPQCAAEGGHFLGRLTLLTYGPGAKAGQFSSNDQSSSEQFWKS